MSPSSLWRPRTHKDNTPSTLHASTANSVYKRQTKKVLQPLAPFRAGGGMRCRSEIGNRRMKPGLHGEPFNSVVACQREDEGERRSRFLYGPFVPSSSKPIWQTLAPLSYRRLPPTCEEQLRPRNMFRGRNALHTAPAMGNSSSGGLSGTSSEFPKLGDRPATSSAAGAQPPRGKPVLSFGDDPSEPWEPWRRVRTPELATQNSLSPGSPGADASPSGARATMGRSLSEKSPGHGARPSTIARRKTGLSPKARCSILQNRKECDGVAAGIGLIPLGISMNSDELEERSLEPVEIKMAKEVFLRFQDLSTVHVEDLSKCLVALGYIQPHEEWIPGLLKPITSYASLPMDNYLAFVEAYRLKQTVKLKTDFDLIDADGSGTLDGDELAGLLHSWGIWPMSHVLEEVLEECDEAGMGDLDFEEFEKVVQVLTQRHYFSKCEYEEICAIFESFSNHHAGYMEPHEVPVALDWLGFPVRLDQVDSIVQELDKDGHGRIYEQEWLAFIARVREAKVIELQHIAVASDVSGDGHIQCDELTGILCSLGYFPDDQAVKEIVQDAGIAVDQDIDISWLWRFLKVYRDREGLSSDEVQEITDGFEHVGVPLDSEAKLAQVGKIVRSIGFMISYDVQQNLIAKVDINGSGTLDQREFRKMIRLIAQQDIDTFVLAFYEAAELKEKVMTKSAAISNSWTVATLTEDSSSYRASMPGDTELVTVVQAQQALRRLGCVDIRGKPAPILPQDRISEDQVDIYGFCAAARRSRQVARAAFRKNGGFSSEDIRVMEESFNFYDSDRSGELCGHEIIAVLQAHFPTLANDAMRRPLILQLLKEADEDGNGSLDFSDFLRLMRQATDIQDQLMIAKELRAIDETRFSPSEVLEFRELMLAVRGEAVEIGFEEVQTLLGAIVPMGAKNVLELKGEFDKVAKCQSGVVGSTDKLDFPEFLWLMRALLDMNFADISERVAEVQRSVGSDSVGRRTFAFL